VPPIPFAGSQLGDVRHVCAFFNNDEAKAGLHDHDSYREGAARQTLAIPAMTRVDQRRGFGDLVPDFAALAAAGLR